MWTETTDLLPEESYDSNGIIWVNPKRLKQAQRSVKTEGERERFTPEIPSTLRQDEFPYGESDQQSRVVITRLADVTSTTIRWLWRSRIPLGKLTVLDGDPGLGKSLISLDIAARLSTARPMPDGTKSDLADPAGVVLCTVEDDLGDTVRPRLEAAGADLSRIVHIKAVHDGDSERMLTLRDLDSIREAISRVSAKLVIIDPLMAYLPGKADAHRDQDVRSVLAPLAVMAAELGVAILVIRHLNKAPGGNPLYRGGGSIGVIAAARSGLLVTKDPEDGERCSLAVTKSNLAKLPLALAYRVTENAAKIPSIVWEGATEYTANMLLTVQGKGKGRSALDEAKDFLREVRAEGPVSTEVVQQQAAQAGIANRPLKRARADLGIEAKRVGRPWEEEQRWDMSLPSKEAKSAEEGQQKKVAPFREFGPIVFGTEIVGGELMR